MLKKYGLVLIASMLVAQPIFADDSMDSDDKLCASIAKACVDAGYKHSAGEGKYFWQNCMKPLILGKTVSNVSIDTTAVKECRTAKIKQLSHLLDALKKADSK
jgi:hypothetical protein